MLTVVYIEDDERLGRLTARYLETHGITVHLATEPLSGLDLIGRVKPDVILLDLMLPTLDGFAVCRKIRERLATPIVMVTARGEEADRVMGLEGGADDYIAKPFSSRELVARIRAHARRASGQVGPSAAVLMIGDLEIDPLARRAVHLGQELPLTTYEFDLLRALVEKAGQVLTREQLMDLVRGSVDEAFDRSIDVHISRLRKKLGDNPKEPTMLKTVRGVGYLFTGKRT